MLSHRLISASALALLTIPASAQIGATSIGGQSPRGPGLRSDRALLVDAAGQGDFLDLPEAVAAAPDGALLVMKAGVYTPAVISGQSLRIESDPPGAARIDGTLLLQGLTGRERVSIGGLFFLEGFEVSGCTAEVSFSGCVAVNDDLFGLYPDGVQFYEVDECGIGTSRHRILASTAVTLVDCDFAGRDGRVVPVCDGNPGEHALLVEDSRVALYGGSFVGGNGSDGPGCHGAWGGAGGDGVLARGATTRVFTCGISGHGGTGGLDMDSGVNNGCPGELTRTQDMALVEACGPQHVRLQIEPLVAAGARPSYTITGPAGADIFLMIAPRRGWREFVANEGVLHVAGPTTIVPLGTLSSAGTITRPFPAPRPAWVGGYSAVELQVYARVGGQDRYSEPRALQVFYR